MHAAGDEVDAPCRGPCCHHGSMGRARTPEETVAATTAAQIGVVDGSFHGGGGEVRHDLLLLDVRKAAD